MKIIINELQLKKLLSEQKVSNTIKTAQEMLKAVRYAQSTYQCLPESYRYPLHAVLNNLDDGGKVSEKMASLALGIIGRESSFTSGKRWYVMNVIKTAMDTVGMSPSMGPAQMTKETAEMVGMSSDEIKKELGALRAVVLLLNKLYNKAKEIGYTTEPSNVKGGTGDAAMDYAIMAYNVGISAIKPYCESTNEVRKAKNLKTSCEKIKNEKQRVVVKNYIPNFNTDRWDGVDTWSHGYIAEVAKTSKEKLECFPKIGSFPEPNFVPKFA